MTIRIAEEWFGICGGCEMSVTDMGERLIELLEDAEFVHIPILMDHKYYGQRGEKKNLEIPEADVGIVTGAIRNDEHIEILKEMRKKCKVLIALGSCAAFGGIPALANLTTTEEILNTVYRDSPSTDETPPPTEDVPQLTDRVYAVDEFVKVDMVIPGCPPSPNTIDDAITALVEGREWKLPEKSVCDFCPANRNRKTKVEMKRNIQPPMEDLTRPPSEMKCFLEQGILCMGPVTRAGCQDPETNVPRCINALMPCRGCYGPVKEGRSQMVDLLSALATHGISPEEIVDRLAMTTWFTGAHDNLRRRE